ncbi:MAG: glycosyltransferase [Bacteroidetes bacterium]|nr:glycosyltransferase [Bacteroidota bacterium]
MNKKILIITYYWPPSGGAGVQRWLKYSRYLLNSGILPIVVTVDAQKAAYPVIDNSLLYEIPKEVKVHSTDTFEPFEIYRILSRKKQIPFAGFANEGKLTLFKRTVRFIRGNFFIPDARKGWNKYAFEKCCELIEKENIDTILVTSPPQSSQLIGLQLKKKYQLKWIADIRDPWTDIYYYDKLLHTKRSKKKDLRYEREVLENADKVIVVSNSIKKMFAAKSDKIASEKIHVMPNGFDENDFKVSAPESNNEFIITYTGTITGDYKIESFLKAFKILIEKNRDTKFKLRFVGSVSGEIKNLLERILKFNSEIIPHVAHAESVKYLLSSTLLLLAIPDVKDNEGILTGKLFEYLASQKPIICLGPVHGEAAQIISDCVAGKSFQYDAESEIHAALEHSFKNWKNGILLREKSDSYKKYSRQIQAKEIAEIIIN